MKSFNEFCDSFATNRWCAGSKTAKEIYDFLCLKESRIKMASAADWGITPLTAVVDDLIEIANREDSDLDLSTKLERQTIGRMVAEAISDLGYRPASRARVLTKHPKNTFSTAVTYRLHEELAKEKIVKHIVDFI